MAVDICEIKNGCVGDSCIHYLICTSGIKIIKDDDKKDDKK